MTKHAKKDVRNATNAIIERQRQLIKSKQRQLELQQKQSDQRKTKLAKKHHPPSDEASPATTTSTATVSSLSLPPSVTPASASIRRTATKGPVVALCLWRHDSVARRREFHIRTRTGAQQTAVFRRRADVAARVRSPRGDVV
jgi:hypothetical protein